MSQTIIAVCALVVAVYSIYATIRHHKLSVTPKLVSYTHRDRQPEGILVTFDISNHGLGPARVVGFDFFLNGKIFTAKYDPVEQLLKAGLEGKVPHEIKRSGFPGRDYFFTVGQKYLVAEVFLPGAKQSDELRLNEIFSRMNLRIEYESLYGEPPLSKLAGMAG